MTVVIGIIILVAILFFINSGSGQSTNVQSNKVDNIPVPNLNSNDMVLEYK